MEQNVFAPEQTLQVVEKNTHGAQSGRFDLVRIDYAVKHGDYFRAAIRANQMKIVPMKGIGKSRSKHRGPDEQENANKAGDFWSGAHC